MCALVHSTSDIRDCTVAGISIRRWRNDVLAVIRGVVSSGILKALSCIARCRGLVSPIVCRGHRVER